MKKLEMKSPYRQGAEDGIIFGLWLAAIVFGTIFSTAVPALSLPVLLMMLLVPVLIFLLQRRYYVAERGFATTSALWMQGLVMSGCGALLAFVSAYVYMKWVSPGYLDEAYRQGIDSMLDSGVPELVNYAKEVDKMTGGTNIITPRDFCIGMIWTTILCGSIASLVSGFVVGLIPIKKKTV